MRGALGSRKTTCARSVQPEIINYRWPPLRDGFIFWKGPCAISRFHLIAVDYAIIDYGDHPGSQRRWRLSTCRTIIQRRIIMIIIISSSSSRKTAVPPQDKAFVVYARVRRARHTHTQRWPLCAGREYSRGVSNHCRV